jgi:hypothetical protein
MEIVFRRVQGKRQNATDQDESETVFHHLPMPDFGFRR